MAEEEDAEGIREEGIAAEDALREVPRSQGVADLDPMALPGGGPGAERLAIPRRRAGIKGDLSGRLLAGIWTGVLEKLRSGGRLPGRAFGIVNIGVGIRPGGIVHISFSVFRFFVFGYIPKCFSARSHAASLASARTRADLGDRGF